MDNQSASQTLFALAAQATNFPAYLSALPPELISAELPASLAEDAVVAALLANDPALADRLSSHAQPQRFGIPAGVTIPALCALLFVMGLDIEIKREPDTGWHVRITKPSMDPIVIFKTTTGEVIKFVYQLLEKLIGQMRKEKA